MKFMLFITLSISFENSFLCVLNFYFIVGCSENGVPPLISSLSHGVQLFPELVNDPVVDLSVSDFTSFVITRSGKVYWW